jgi:hypothetical protein
LGEIGLGFAGCAFEGERGEESGGRVRGEGAAMVIRDAACDGGDD